MIRKALVLAAVLLGALLFAPSALAQYQPNQPGLILNPSTTTPGGDVTAVGFGCARRVTVTITIGGEIVGTTITGDDPKGSFSVPFKAPTTPGEYTVTAQCGTTIMSSVLTVIAAPTTTTSIVSGTVLPITGSDSTVPLIRIGLLLIAVGGLLLLAVRRYRETN